MKYDSFILKEALKLKYFNLRSSNLETSICLNKTLIVLTYGIISLRLRSWALLDRILIGCIGNQPYSVIVQGILGPGEGGFKQCVVGFGPTIKQPGKL